jgi:hypothetical protein
MNDRMNFRNKVALVTGAGWPMTASGHERLGEGKLQVQQCPQCPVSDGRPEKGRLSLRARKRHPSDL